MSPLLQPPAALYGEAVLLAIFAAVSELLGRFKDEPFKVLRSGPSAAYFLLNGAVAALVLLGLRSAAEADTGIGQLEQVLLAGFGARVLVRTKVVGIRTKEGAAQEVGPGAVFDQLLTSISREIDRDRAVERLTTVTELLRGLSRARAHDFFVMEMAGAMQDLTDAEKSDLTANLAQIEASTDLDEATRLDLLGYLILNYAGEEFLKGLVGLYRQRFPS